MKTEPEVKEETKTEETVEKTVETVKTESAKEVTKADEPKEGKKGEEKPSDDKGEEVEKADEAEKVDSFAACMKALDGELDDKGKESCSKLFHKMVEKGLNCACEKCTKAIEGEKAEKATADNDLHKAVETEAESMQKFAPADELAKAMGVIDELKKGFDALKSDNEALKKQVEKLENEPVAGGAMVATGTMTLDKTIGGNVGKPPVANSEADVLKKMIAETDSAVLKEAYSKQLAQLEMKKVFG